MEASQLTLFRNEFHTMILLFVILGLGCTSAPSREDARVIDAKVDAALARLKKDVKGADSLLRSASGMLVFPGVLQAAFWGGAEYGKGALRIGGVNVDYYNIAAASFGLQFGAQKKDIILLFMNDQVLQDFRNSSGWTAGVDGTVALVTVGAEGSINTTTLNEPILAFVVDQTGLMAGVSLEGSKITKLQRQVPRRVEKTRNHIETGMLVSPPALTWDNRISC
ncbi:BPSL1445 family SYLF domain-containing lipoprotein [Methylocaldum sp.]|uniref:BPSL1445 family SYLF domain-containing lipoprotein n=1 Tax=Methylocaldum sp. TaxID=1969727 RepID=UPI002D4F8AE5|nr:YSC84-related protein [Methylocaldum sp.]HYE36863.1 YSC84-related protein [Methylocaldum sp.]